jgi:hypothetical protein
MRRIAAVLVLATALIMCSSSTASASTTTIACANDVSAGIVSRWCNVVSTSYPDVKGWYGYVGRGGGPCNSNPRGTEFPVGSATVGICAAPAPIKAWRYTAAGWVGTGLNDGTRGYIHPYNATWRWLYADNAWYAIEARNLTIEWLAEQRAQHANE